MAYGLGSLYYSNYRVRVMGIGSLWFEAGTC